MKYKNPVESFESLVASGAYQIDNSPSPIAALTSQVSGSVHLGTPEFLAWQPSTWPPHPYRWDPCFVEILRKIFYESILVEIKNIIEDAQERNGSLEHRGHVVGLAILCALDAISSYGYGAKSGDQIPDFIKAYFPSEYHPHASTIKKIYRNCLVHSWNLFGVALTPGNDPISNNHGILSIGILNLNEALVLSTNRFLMELETDTVLQSMALNRYLSLRNTAKP